MRVAVQRRRPNHGAAPDRPSVVAIDIERETELALEPLEDLGVLVLFSVFEAAVRDHLTGVIAPLTSQLGHAILKAAAEDALEGIRQGSFANRVLTPLQDQGRISPELSDRVKQVRDYRNWVAHGKRESRSSGIINLDAREAFARLKEFLEALNIAEGSEREHPDSADRGTSEA